MPRQHAFQPDGATGSPTVSVVITTLGHSWLATAVASALTQTYEPLEIIVVDDRPLSEATALVLGSGDRRITVTRAGGMGANHARNCGIQLASGALIALLDDDDRWFPQKLARQVSLFLESDKPALTLVTCKAVLEPGGRVYPRLPYSGGALADYLFRGHFPRLRYNALIQTSSFLCPRDLALAVPFREGLRAHQDWDWLLTLEAAAVTLDTVNEPLYAYAAPSPGGVRSSLRLEAEQAWALQSLTHGSKALFGYFVSIATPRALRCGRLRDAQRALSIGVRYGQWDAWTALMGVLYAI
jgi:glycosyltransferase involved in cell wall biosynthesis